MRANTLLGIACAALLAMGDVGCGGGKIDATAGGDAGAPGVDDSGGAIDGGAGDGDVGSDGSVDLGTQCSADRVDILLMVDNSASMGTKVDYLRVAVPDLVGRLTAPNCVANGHVVAKSHDGVCDQGSIEFPPVHDLHLAVVTSSLGPRGGDVCQPQKLPNGLDSHNDDQGHLIDRAGADEHAIADMGTSNYLAWFPNVPANAGKAPPTGANAIGNASALAQDFQDLLDGVHQNGCGIESQLESWYRFLVQPDPYASIAVTPRANELVATWSGVDATILKQRHDFLRPDSLVLVLDMTDENDSEIDVRALGGQAYYWMRSDFTPPRGTSACATNPADPACVSCAQKPDDPGCAQGTYPNIESDWGYNPNLRHVHMKAKYGVDVQFPIARYVHGLTDDKVPNRDGEYPPNAANYVGNPNCTNPLFAASLPDGSSTDSATLCNLPRGPRRSDFVLYAHIGGVPNALLHIVPNDPAATALVDADWMRILGKSPETSDYSGIDPHMIESYEPRMGLPPPAASDTSDSESGREWITNATAASIDLEYACTFPLLAQIDCTIPANQSACDCPTTPGTAHDELPPLCDATTTTTQVRGKAYPTVRELEVARGLGARSIVGSICPIHSAEQSPGDPLYGYRPAVTAIVDRVGKELARSCQ